MLFLLYLALMLFPAIAAIAYLNAFAVARLCGKCVCHQATDCQTSFVLLVPAHDEERSIRNTLESIAAVNYDGSKLTTVVIADNCSDRTAEIARECGVQCLERTDTSKLGKGFALSWGLEQIQSIEFDAVAIVDADCPIEPDLLQVLDGFFQSGAEAIQANHLVTNADASPIAYAASVGRALEYDLLYASKSAFGLPVMLVGTGMAFRRALLEAIPWNSHGCAEDTEYTLELGKRGICVQFAANGHVHCSGATSKLELDVQRSRWAAGNLALGRAHGLRLLVSGLMQKEWLLADLGASLLILSRPLLIAHAVATLLFGVGIQWLWPNAVHRYAAFLAVCLIPAYALWIGIGVSWIGINRQRFMHLLRSPFVVSQLAWIAVRSAIVGPNVAWRRTPRV